MVEKECCKGSRNMTREQKTILYWSTVREIFQTMAEITRHYLNSIFIFAIEHQKKIANILTTTDCGFLG